MALKRNTISGKSRALKHEVKISILRDAIIGAFLIFVLLLGKLWFEQTTIGNAVESLGFAELQRHLIPTGLVQQPNVVLVDISGIHREKWELNGKSGECTPRADILKIVVALARTKPRGIAVDIDFSPFEDGLVHPDDMMFFASILDTAKRSGTRVFLGVDRQRFSGPEKWLGQAEFSELAAAIAIPEATDSRYYMRWAKGNEQSRSLPSMALAIAGKTEEAGREDHGSWHHYVQTSQTRSGSEPPHNGVMSWALTNYAALSALKLEQIATSKPETIQENAQRFQGRAVILGDIRNFDGNDHFDIGLLHPDDLPGVFLHACGSITAQAPPLLELTHHGRLVVDLLIAIVLVGLIASIRFGVALRSGSDVADSDRLFRRLVGAAAVLCVAFALGFIQQTHVMWTDFISVVMALVAHLMFHHPAGNFLARFFPFLRHQRHHP